MGRRRRGTFSLSPPHPQREVLVDSLTNKRFQLKGTTGPCNPLGFGVFLSILSNMSLTSRTSTLHLNFSLSPPPPSTRTSRCIVEKFVTPLKEKFSLPISIFHSLLPHPQRDVLFVSLTTSST